MKLYLETKDYTLTGESYQLFHDSEMDMLVTKPQPENLAKYYESDNYISHTDANTSFIDRIYQLVKGYNLKRKVSIINSFASEKKTLLDVGAGTGDFVATAKLQGWNAYGVEPSTLAKSKAADKDVLLFANLEEVPQLKFDVITLWHVLEHLPNLEAQISKLTHLLARNGTIVVAVPNFKSYDALHYKNYWAAFDVPRHLWHFSRNSIKHIFLKHGLNLIKTKPMYFDAFYVSLLSEKYKTGKQNLLTAFCIGLWSNWRALKTKEYSSIIYMIKR